jgi:hypothetical protein
MNIFIKLANKIKEKYVSVGIYCIMKYYGVPRPTRFAIENNFIEFVDGDIKSIATDMRVLQPEIKDVDYVKGLNRAYDPSQPKAQPHHLYFKISELEKTGWVREFVCKDNVWATDHFWNGNDRLWWNDRLNKAHWAAEEFAKKYFNEDKVKEEPLKMIGYERVKLLEHKEIKCLRHF